MRTQRGSPKGAPPRRAVMGSLQRGSQEGSPALKSRWGSMQEGLPTEGLPGGAHGTLDYASAFE